MAVPLPAVATAGEDTNGRTAFEVADVVRAYGASFLRTHPASGEQRRVLRAIARCRTTALGGHVEGCDGCGYQRVAYNSCRNRHCPKCQGAARAKWMAAEQATLLPVEYFHVVFTLPHALNALIRINPRQLYRLLFHAAAATLLAFARDPKHLGGDPAITIVLHTWGQNLTEHAHVHCVMSGGGLSPDARSFHSTKRRGFLFPVKALSKMFRGKYLAALDRLQRQGVLRFTGQSARLAEASNWLQLLTGLRRTPWVVYVKLPFGGPQCVLKYLSRYTHRVAISNRRILFVGDGVVRFAWKDYTDHDARKEMTLRAEEFLRRFLLHVVPRGFMRIRHYGLLANCHRAPKLARCRELLALAPPPAPSADLDDAGRCGNDDADRPSASAPPPCPACGKPMRVVEILPPHRHDTS
ncbi:MAG TPA: IS91 family transposase [Candidatus Margulisiibacteriota bacterium]|nr:IS91 family transposase [Candidatus Margulisiibacteriota bacterium]